MIFTSEEIQLMKLLNSLPRRIYNPFIGQGRADCRDAELVNKGG